MYVLCCRVRTIGKEGLGLIRRPGGNASDMLVASTVAPVKAKCMFVLVGRESREHENPTVTLLLWYPSLAHQNQSADHARFFIRSV